MVSINRRIDGLRDFSPDDVDLRLAIALSWRDYEVNLHNQVLDAIADAAREHLPSDLQSEIRGGPYHYGPMASGPTVQILYTAYEMVRPIAEDIGVWVAVGAFARSVIQKTREILRRWVSETGAEVDPSMYPGIYLSDTLIVSEALIRGLCAEHFVNSYTEANQRVATDVHSRSSFPEIVWAGRPDKSIIYTVRIWTGQTSYVYIVDGRSKPIEHFRIRGNEFIALPLPQWHDEPIY